jgi:hypothetical protein
MEDLYNEKYKIVKTLEDGKIYHVPGAAESIL